MNDDDFNFYNHDIQPVLAQDSIPNNYRGKIGTKKLGLIGNSNKFSSPAGVGLLPTPHPISLFPSTPRPTSSGHPSPPSFQRVILPSSHTLNTPTSFAPMSISFTAPALSSCSSIPPLFSTPSLPKPLLATRPKFPFATSNIRPVVLEDVPNPAPQTFCNDLAKHIRSQLFHENKRAFFNRCADSGYLPPFTLPTFTSDLTKGLSHNSTVQYHEAVAVLRTSICRIWSEHHKNLQHEETLKIASLQTTLAQLYDPDVVRLINENSTRMAKLSKDNKQNPGRRNRR